MRRLIRDISSVLILSGLLLVLDAGVTLAWQEPVTAALGVILRSNIDQRYLSYRTAPLSRLDVSALGPLRSTDQRIAFLARREARQVKAGDAIGQLEIPKLGVRYQHGTGTAASSF